MASVSVVESLLGYKNWVQNCLTFIQISFENLAPQVSRQICKELHHLISEPPEGIKAILNEEDISDIQAIIDGPGKMKIIILNNDFLDSKVVFSFSRDTLC